MTAILDKTEVSDSFPSTIRGGDLLAATTQAGTLGADEGTVMVEIPIARRPKQQARIAPLRRLRGFVIAFCGQEVRVSFVGPDGGIVEYLLPSTSLKRAGITEENQPFEMDEIEETANGEYSLTYRFRPMASAASAVTDILESDERLSELRDAALQHFGNGSDH